MNNRAIRSFLIALILIIAVSFVSTDPAFAEEYKKSQVVSQVNECGNYGFPINIICSNLSSPVQGDENNIVVTTESGSGSNYGTPFP